MTKILVCPINNTNLNELINFKIDGFVLGLKGFSVFLNKEFTLKEIKEIRLKTNKNIYVAITKMIYNNDLKKLTNILIELSMIKIQGVIFEDISVVNINNEKKLNLNLVFNQLHLGTNNFTANFWYKRDVKSFFLSTELMLSDFIEIKKNTKAEIFVYLYGYLPMFYSSRKLLTNYFNYINQPKKANSYLMYEKQKDEYYRIFEHNNETFISEKILNGINEFKEISNNKIDYVILNGLHHKRKDFNFIVKCFIKEKEGKLNDKEKIKTNKGFLFKESIYKVKL